MIATLASAADSSAESDEKAYVEKSTPVGDTSDDEIAAGDESLFTPTFNSADEMINACISVNTAKEFDQISKYSFKSTPVNCCADYLTILFRPLNKTMSNLFMLYCRQNKVYNTYHSDIFDTAHNFVCFGFAMIAGFGEALSGVDFHIFRKVADDTSIIDEFTRFQRPKCLALRGNARHQRR